MVYDVKEVTSRASTDCGVACMVSFLDYYGIEVDMDTVRKECNPKVSGTTGGDLLKCGRLHGLDMKAWKESWVPIDVREDAEKNSVDIIKQDRPSICWWQKRHWIICCGLNENGKVEIMNPSRGRYSISQKMFEAFYSGISITNGVPEWAPNEESVE